MENIHGICTGTAFREQMQRFITRTAHERAFRTPGYDAFLANEVRKLFVVIKHGE